MMPLHHAPSKDLMYIDVTIIVLLRNQTLNMCICHQMEIAEVKVHVG